MAEMLPSGNGRSFIEHLRELYVRVLWCVGAVFAGSSLAYYYHEQLLALLVKPLHQVVFSSSPAGAFNFILDLCMLFGLVLALPVIIYHIIRFLQPAFPKHVQPRVFALTSGSYALASVGGAVAYFIALPAALRFLSSFNVGQVQSLISADSYFTFVLFYLAGFAIIFQLPIIFLFINWIRPFAAKELWELERWVILLSFIIAAIINPAPDPVTQGLTAVPLIIIYQVSFLTVVLANRKKTASLLSGGLTWRLGLAIIVLGFLVGALLAVVESLLRIY